MYVVVPLNAQFVDLDHDQVFAMIRPLVECESAVGLNPIGDGAALILNEPPDDTTELEAVARQAHALAVEQGLEPDDVQIIDDAEYERLLLAEDGA